MWEANNSQNEIGKFTRPSKATQVTMGPFCDGLRINPEEIFLFPFCKRTQPKMTFFPDCFAFTLLLSVRTAQRIPTRPVIINDTIYTGSILRRPATIPAICKPQAACPTSRGFFVCSVCTRTITRYIRRLTRCRRRVSARARRQLLRACRVQCAAAGRQISRARPVSSHERGATRQAACSRKCRARIFASPRRRRPPALVISAQSGTKYRPGFHLFAPWLWTRARGNNVLDLARRCADGRGTKATGFARGSGRRARRAAQFVGRFRSTVKCPFERRTVCGADRRRVQDVKRFKLLLQGPPC